MPHYVVDVHSSGVVVKWGSNVMILLPLIYSAILAIFVDILSDCLTIHIHLMMYLVM